ncbi:uncharacterized protein A1O9_03799 [Exophiala aquamarina CBS 119918]|uniref:AMMECR1 domain-containing protein n=1 Tax=Exophiala aquamarina CBS 119918 TaxID=1182545 RepID=A0A072PGH1_9EURO|nr:uncharacterized protein A1O9_03799 [Exophiala aquamarina CBS 119918]KEF58956.1 hypothetical protein A1O9_03799 [Exophiala aquamarina CBS 119918]
MASPAHCFFCFETLAASFDHRDPPTLQKVLDTYDQYILRDKIIEEGGSTAGDEDETRLGPDGSKSDEGEDDEEDEERGQEEEQRIQRRTAPAASPQNPSISRLQASTSSSRSSSASSPSLNSSTSSSSHVTAMSSTTSILSSPPSYASRLSVTDSYPLFVTWNTLSRSGHKSLRGCIGTFEALPLASGLATYALTSAFDDTRFSPIPASLLPGLSCSLTLLADFEPCQDAMDWILGVHGLRISFTHRNRRHGATYLPDVAVEQGWSKEDTVESLMKKAGWDGGYGHGVARRLLRGSGRGEQQSPKPWEEVNDFRAVRYTGLKSSATFSEWKEWRDWVNKEGDSLR